MTTPINPDLQNILLNLYHSYNGADGSEFPVDKATTEINHYILSEVLYLLGPTEKETFEDGCGYDEEIHVRNELRQELRAKAQERWGV